MEREQVLLYEKEVQIPVYFAHETPELTAVYEEVQLLGQSTQKASALEGMIKLDL